MSLLGQSLLTFSVPVPTNVRYASDSDRQPSRDRLTLCPYLVDVVGEYEPLEIEVSMPSLGTRGVAYELGVPVGRS